MTRSFNTRFNKRYLLLFSFVSICFGQLQVGDIIPDDMGLPYCCNNEIEGDSLFLHDYNGETNALGQHYVIWLNIFTSW